MKTKQEKKKYIYIYKLIDLNTESTDLNWNVKLVEEDIINGDKQHIFVSKKQYVSAN